MAVNAEKRTLQAQQMPNPQQQKAIPSRSLKTTRKQRRKPMGRQSRQEKPTSRTSPKERKPTKQPLFKFRSIKLQGRRERKVEENRLTQKVNPRVPIPML